jgi:hypothetical protein
MTAIAGIGKDDEEEKKDDEPVQMSAYKSPPGGTIVRGTQYKGGSFIPDMQGSFMNPRRKLFYRLK